MLITHLKSCAAGAGAARDDIKVTYLYVYFDLIQYV